MEVFGQFGQANAPFVLLLPQRFNFHHQFLQLNKSDTNTGPMLAKGSQDILKRL